MEPRAQGVGEFGTIHVSANVTILTKPELRDAQALHGELVLLPGKLVLPPGMLLEPSLAPSQSRQKHVRPEMCESNLLRGRMRHDVVPHLLRALFSNHQPLVNHPALKPWLRDLRRQNLWTP